MARGRDGYYRLRIDKQQQYVMFIIVIFILLR